MPNIFKFSNAGGFKTLTRYPDMLAGNTVWNPYSPTGAYDALATVTVPSGGLSSITFSGIPSTYTHLEIRYLAQDNRSTFATDDLGIQLNGDTSTSSYTAHRLYGYGSGTATSDGFSTSSALGAFLGGFIGSTVGQFGAGVIDFLDYSNTSKNKVLRVISGSDNNGGSGSLAGQVGLTSGAWLNTSAINSIKIYGYNGSTLSQYSTFSLYGIK